MKLDPTTANQIWLNLFYTPTTLSIPADGPQEQESNRQALYRARRRLIADDKAKEELFQFEIGRASDFSVTITPANLIEESTIAKLAELGLSPVTVTPFIPSFEFNPDEEPEYEESASIADILYGNKSTPPDENNT